MLRIGSDDDNERAVEMLKKTARPGFHQHNLLCNSFKISKDSDSFRFCGAIKWKCITVIFTLSNKVTKGYLATIVQKNMLARVKS